ncbi:MAG: S-layer homology domain-containing protein [Clostridia bacterium]|nr:S-layer homology domain-containing protein [Clostridia bacterium]
MKKLLCALIILTLIFPVGVFASGEVSTNTPETVYPGMELDFDSLEEATGTQTDTSIVSSIITLAGDTGSSANKWVMAINNANSAGSGKYFADIVKNGTEENPTSALLLRMNTGGSNSGPQLRFMVEKTWYRNQGQTVGAVHTIEMDVTPLSGAYIRLIAAARTTRQEGLPWIYIFNNGKIANTQTKYILGHTYHVKLTFDTAALKYYLWLDDDLYEEKSYTPTAASLNPNTISFIEYTMVDQFADISAENEAKLLIDNYKSYYNYDAPLVTSVSYIDKEGNSFESDSVKYNAGSVNVTLSRVIGNVEGNVALKNENGDEIPVASELSEDGKTVSVIPDDELSPNENYEIVLGSDVTYDVLHASSSEYSTITETRYLGTEIVAKFKTQPENIIVLPKSGDHIAAKDGKITFSANVKEDVTSVDFYVDDYLIGSAVPDDNLTAILEASADELAIGQKELKAVFHGTEDIELKTDFWFSNPEKANKIVEKLGEDISKEEFISLITSNEILLEINNEDQFYNDNKEEILTLLYNSVDSFDDVEHFGEELGRAYALTALSKTTPEDVPSCLEVNAENLGIDYGADYENEERLDSEAKQVLCTYLSTKDFTESFSDFKSAYSELVILSAISTVDVWSEIEIILTKDFENEFEAMLEGNSDYKKLPSKQKVYQYMMNYDYDEYADIEENFEKAAKKAYDEYKDKKSSGSSGGGGGSKGSSSVVIDPAIITQPNVQIPVPSDVPALLNQNAVSSFADVPSSHWSYKAVSALSDSGIINGYDNNTFMPDSPITRAEFAKLLSLSFNFNNGTAKFVDVSDVDWFASSVKAAASRGIIQGYEGSFMPGQSITRQDAAVMIYRTFAYLGKTLNGRAEYDDAMDIALYALPAVGALKDNSVMVGNSGKFNPEASISRAEASQLLYNAINFMNQNKEAN